MADFRVWPLMVALLAPVFCSSAYAQQAGDTQGVLIDRLLTEVQLGLAKVQVDLHDDGVPPLESVTLNLTAAVKKEVGGKISFFVVSFGQKVDVSRTQEVEVTLKPPKPNQVAALPKGPSVSQQLVQAIESAARGVQSARGNSQVPLVASGLKVILTFVVEGDTSGGAKFQIVPVTVDLAGDIANSTVQKITVLYQNPQGKK